MNRRSLPRLSVPSRFCSDWHFYALISLRNVSPLIETPMDAG